VSFFCDESIPDENTFARPIHNREPLPVDPRIAARAAPTADAFDSRGTTRP
jgi:hypothetical protein